MFTMLAHRLASTADTSRPSGATVAFSCEPSPGWIVEVDEYDDDGTPPALLFAVAYDMAEVELTLPLGVGAGYGYRFVLSSRRDSSPARSSLLPTRRRERLGEARARASLRKGCRLLNEVCEVTS
jgi:hypothetical protein